MRNLNGKDRRTHKRPTTPDRAVSLRAHVAKWRETSKDADRYFRYAVEAGLVSEETEKLFFEAAWAFARDVREGLLDVSGYSDRDVANAVRRYYDIIS